MNKNKNLIKNYKQYDYISRYESFPYFYDKDNNRYYYGITSNLDPSTSYVLHKVKPGDTYDSIAYQYYGNALFYWVICDFNNILDCLTQPTTGTQLKLPPLNSMSDKL